MSLEVEEQCLQSDETSVWLISVFEGLIKGNRGYNMDIYLTSILILSQF